jgi:trk system potassium uptake protein TrkA
MGRFGASVARTLASLGYDVLAVDKDPKAVDEIAEHVTQAVAADATDEDSLLEIGIRNFEVAIVGIASDVESSVLTTVLLKRIGVPLVIARAQSELHALTLEKIGADRVVFPERDHGVRVAHSLVNPDVQDYMELAPNFGVSKVRPPLKFVGKTLEECELDPEGKFGITVLALRRGNQVILDPDKSEIIQQGDMLVLAGVDEGLERLRTAVKV